MGSSATRIHSARHPRWTHLTEPAQRHGATNSSAAPVESRQILHSLDTSVRIVASDSSGPLFSSFMGIGIAIGEIESDRVGLRVGWVGGGWDSGFHILKNAKSDTANFFKTPPLTPITNPPPVSTGCGG